MSDMAKKARAAMKAKAKSLTSASNGKVDSSTWTAPEPLNTEAKTGMRPLSRRAFKDGGKVKGEKAKANMGKAPRGNNKPITPDTMANKDVKAANDDRAGIKHVGGMKKGGRANCNTGGGTFTKGGKDYQMTPNGPRPLQDEGAPSKQPPMPQRPQREPEKGMSGDEASDFMKARKAGGRAKKAAGGTDLSNYGAGVAGAADMMKKASDRAGVPGGLYGNNFTKIQRGSLSPLKAAGMGAKTGGKIKEDDEKKEGHEDEAMDKALIRKMVKPSARTGKDNGGGIYNRVAAKYAPKESMDETVSKLQGTKAAVERDLGMRPDEVPDSYKKGGRAARKAGGRAKGKTNINIVIAAGKPADQGMGMPGGPTKPPGMDAGPAGVPVPMPAPQGAPGGAAPMPMPIPMPMPAPAAGPAPAPRKNGGRITKVAKSYKDMEAGAASGEGRLQKTDIAKRVPKPKQNGENVYTGLGYPNKVPGATGGRTAKKAGGRTYRSYKDMDAGAGSGVGRMEKAEIQSRK